MELKALLDLLNTNNIHVNLLTGYHPATITEKAETPLYFEVKDKFYAMPKYEITTAGNLNSTFCVNGIVHDTLNNREFNAHQFKSVSFVKNGKLFKDKLYISDEDIAKVKELGIEVTDGYIDLTKCAIIGNSKVDAATIADLAVGEWCRKAIMPKVTKNVENLTEDEAWLKDNGYVNGVWCPKAEYRTTVVENNGTVVKIAIAKCSGKPNLEKIKEKIKEGKKLTFSENVVNTILGKKIEDRSKELNNAIYNVIVSGNSIEEEVKVNKFNIEFNVTVTIK